jgi:hypothetical protein
LKREHFEKAKRSKCHIGMTTVDRKLKPSETYPEMKKKEFFKRGGTIKKLNPGPDCRLMGEVNCLGKNNSAAQTTFFREHC